jgi:hypothetical protein
MNALTSILAAVGVFAFLIPVLYGTYAVSAMSRPP